ncbi:hypothetical protein BS333_00990 [Vibrio azureus]|uniref:Uncharacterized protein n=1 Tax=Vibrio azureus NBRC 104587 TaxID=1219077 RepID=U3CBG6_9VIBR|nr:hypothetical protein [Vibrio azureus]AUI85071.1 hypothetical protein BS333_00990 [Vibrio azureus]GAD75708.1 hypothetical protein VAZ01S_028_00620 [Vibrio azureus NBRC 104587]
MKKQQGSIIPLFILVMLSAFVFTYYTYDISRSYLAAKVQINTTREINNLISISGDTLTDINQSIAQLNGLDIDHSKGDWSYDNYEENDVISVVSTVNLTQHRKLTQALPDVSDDGFEVETKTIRAKHYEDLNIIVTISDDSETKYLVNSVKYSLNNALKVLFEHTNSNLTVVPFGYRININGKCWTTFPRGDGFSFQWWEAYYAQLDILDALEQQQQNIDNLIANTRHQIEQKQARIDEIDQLLATTDDPEEIDNLNAEKEALEDEIQELQRQLEDLLNQKEDIDNQVNDQQQTIEDLQSSPTFMKYNELADHYAKSGQNYLYIDNYFDAFLYDHSYDYTEDDARDDALVTEFKPGSLNKLSITKNKYFGNSQTCPSKAVIEETTSYRAFLSTVNQMSFSSPFVSPIQGVNYALKHSFLSNKANRTAVIHLTALTDDKLSEQDQKESDKDILQQFCQTIKKDYIHDVSAKSIFIVNDDSNISEIESLECANLWHDQYSIINIDEFDDDDLLTDRIAYELLQESSSNYIGNINES